MTATGANREALHRAKLQAEDPDLEQIAETHYRADVSRRANSRIAEPLLAGIGPGSHVFQSKQFRALVHYLFEEPRKRMSVLRKGSFRVGKIEFLVAPVDRTNAATLSEFARTHDVPQQTLHDRAGKAGIVFTRRGNKKLFNIDDLKSLLPGP